MPSMEAASPSLRSGYTTPKKGAQSGCATPGGASNYNRPVGSGAEIYRALMEGYHRRLRGAAPTQKNDAAGLLYRDANFHGRGTPLKHKSKGPPDDHQPEHRLCRRVIPGKSHKAEPALLEHNPLNQSMDSAMFSLAAGGVYACRPGTAGSVRSSLRIVEDSPKGQLLGGKMLPITESPSRRVSRAGFFSEQMGASTKPRVMIHAEDVAQAPDNQASPRSFLESAWQKQVTNSRDGLAKSGYPERPTTAPASEARMRYHRANNANTDLYQYRHSSGICPKEYKMETSNRMPAPQLSKPSAPDARNVYDNSRSDYALNRVKSLTSRSCLYWE